MNGTPYTMSVNMACMVLRVKLDLIWHKIVRRETRARYGEHDVIVDSVVASETWRDDSGFCYATQLMED